MNLLRDIPVDNGPLVILNVIVEVSSGSRSKYEYKPEWKVHVLDRGLHSSIDFPVDYGFVPRTWFRDGDPLDTMVLEYEPLHVGCLVKVRTNGTLVMEDEKRDGTKILGAPIGDPRF